MTRARTLSRRHEVEVEFHQVDLAQVVHNSVYLKWFEKGRLGLLEEVFPMSWAIENRVAVPVVVNHCEYLSPAEYGDVLMVTTRHKVTDHWDGRMLFEHSISNRKTKVEVARGYTEVTVIDMRSKRPLKELPDGVWERYQALR